MPHPRKPRTVLSRLILPFAGMIVVVVGIYGVLIYVAGQRAAREQQIDELSRLASLFREQLADSVTPLNENQSHQIRSLARGLATRITLIDASGRVLFDTDADVSAMENHNDRSEIIAARTRGSGSSVRFSHTLNEDAVYVARPLDPGKPNGTILRLSYPQRVWTKLPVPPWVIVLGGAVSVGLLIAWMMLLLQRNWTGPVRELSEAAGHMATGRWHTRAEPRGAPELQDFSRRLNHVAEQAQKQLADLDARRGELQVLVDSLPDPIILTDFDRNVALINRPATKLLDLGPDEVLHKPLTDVLHDVTLMTLLQAAEGSSSDGLLTPHDIVLTRNSQRLYYQAVATRTRGGGVLLVLRNVTTMASAVQMKTDFVANASHELRTPISAIKIAFETLQDVHKEDPQQADRCIAIISEHLTRLEEMLSDLLDLSRVESAEIKPELAIISVDEVFAMVRSTMSATARRKGVELVFQAEASARQQFECDQRLMSLILRNLTENSIKFTPAGGTVTIAVAANEADDSVILRVEDTGIGITAEHLERVFERFYQVDSARASSVGRGTGLGLAIVKHAVHALGGTIDLTSSVGKGTIVTCRLPQHAAVADAVIVN